MDFTPSGVIVFEIIPYICIINLSHYGCNE